MRTKKGWLSLALVVSISVVSSFLVGAANSAAPAAGDTVVDTDSGAVRGSAVDGTRVFEGIPYAAPPVGPLRWKNPKPPAPWRGVRDATRPGPVCAQLPGEIPGGSTSEDCLYLNVTTPSDNPIKPKPVIVWVHGGGYYMGAGSNYDAQRMARRGDVVVVTINYRLGVFGFFGHPGLAGSGTFGLSDQQAALGWVYRNIAAFGGDRGNITLAGQSAGGTSTCAHLTSPSAAGLFDKAVMQSGSCGLNWLNNFDYRGQPTGSIFQPLASLEAHGRKAAVELGCANTDPDAAVACLRELPVDRLMPVHNKFFQPAYGNAVLPMNPAEAVRRGRFYRVPVLSGGTRDEATQSTAIYDRGEPMSEQSYRAVLADTFGADAAKVSAEYPRSAHGSAALAWSAIVTDRKWACTQYDNSRRLAKYVPVHHYEFADPAAPLLSPLPPKMPMGAQHASELWSFFDLGGLPPKFSAEQWRLASQMIDYWTSFAATGDPGYADGPSWPEFDLTGTPPHVQALAPGSDGVRPVNLAAEHRCGFWTELDE